MSEKPEEHVQMDVSQLVLSGYLKPDEDGGGSLPV